MQPVKGEGHSQFVVYSFLFLPWANHFLSLFLLVFLQNAEAMAAEPAVSAAMHLLALLVQWDSSSAVVCGGLLAQLRLSVCQQARWSHAWQVCMGTLPQRHLEYSVVPRVCFFVGTDEQHD